MTDLYPGQEVVCIDAGQPPRTTIPLGIEEGQTYVLRWVGPYVSYVDGEFIGVRLEGVERGKCPTYGHDDPPYAARRFRPLVKDRLAVFRRIAVDPDYKIDAPEGPRRNKKLPVRVPVKEEVE